MALAFGEHPGVKAWQTDNEYGCHDTVESYSNAARSEFRRWCRDTYGEIDTLNTAWGNVFWSMELASFEDIELPNLTVTEANPSHLMDFQRFSSDQVVAFNRRQVEIIRRHSPGRAILHNFMGAFTAFDHYAVGQDLDAAAWDNYPLGFLERSSRDEAFKTRQMRVGDPDFQAFHHDLYRACGRGRWWVMEQQPGAVNWAPWNPTPAPGAVRLWTHEAFAAGAEVVSYFRWRQAPFAQEQTHEGLLLPNSEPNAAYHVAAEVARELSTLPSGMRTERAAVAIIFDYESAWAWNIQPQGQGFSYFELVFAFYRGLRRLGISLDIVEPSPEAVENRKLIVAPGLFTASSELTTALARSGASLLLGPRSGSKTRDFQIPPNLPPGAFRALIDIMTRRVESLRPGATIAVEGGAGYLEGWREFLTLGERARAQLHLVDGEVVLAREGCNYYLAGRPDDLLLETVLRRVLACAKVDVLDLPRDIRVRDNGATRFVFNHGDASVDISSITGDAPLYMGTRSLPPCGVAAFALRAE